MEKVIRYYAFKDDVRIEKPFVNYDDAIDYARKNNCDEIEETVWNSEKAYNNYEPADSFKTVWRMFRALI